MPLSKEERAHLERVLASPYGHAELMCDGFKVTLCVQRYNALKFSVMVYVNDSFKGAWMASDCTEPEVRFLRKYSKPMVSPAKRRDAEKCLGKRAVAREPFYNAVITINRPDWPNGTAALRHICKVSSDVRVLKPLAAQADTSIDEALA